MSLLSSARPTLIDVGRALDPDGKIAKVIDILYEDNEIVDDIVWREGNLPTGHQFTQQTAESTPYFRLLNQGIVPQKTTTGQIVEACAIMENRNQIDVDVANLNGATESFRMSQDKPMIRGFAKTLATKLVYGDSSISSAEFNGLATRYFSTGSTYTTSSQVIDALGRGSDNTSIWLVGWGDEGVFGIYPKGSQVGLQYKDLGIQQVTSDSTTGARLQAYESWMQWKCGLAVANYKYVVRIANIDISDLLTASNSSDSSANIMKFMVQAMYAIPSHSSVNLAFYMNATVQSMLAVKMLDKGNNFLTTKEIQRSVIGSPRSSLAFQGIPCRRVDKILNTESAVLPSST